MREQQIRQRHMRRQQTRRQRMRHQSFQEAVVAEVKWKLTLAARGALSGAQLWLFYKVLCNTMYAVAGIENTNTVPGVVLELFVWMFVVAALKIVVPEEIFGERTPSQAIGQLLQRWWAQEPSVNRPNQQQENTTNEPNVADDELQQQGRNQLN